LVTVSAAGEYAVTATAQDGPAVTGEFRIKITDAAPEVQSVTVNGPDTVMAGKSISLTASVLPAAAEQGVTWAVWANNDGTGDVSSYAAIDSNGELTIDESASAGTVYVIATSTDANNVASAAHEVTITPYVAALWSWSLEKDGKATLPDSTSTAGTLKGNSIFLYSTSNIINSDNGITLNASRFTIGTDSNTSTTATFYHPNGEFDLTGKKVKVTLTYIDGSGSGNIQISINNNTGTQSASVLGNSSRIYSNKPPVAQGETITVTYDATNKTGEVANSLEHAFFQFRTEGGAKITITSITIEEDTGA
jgi:hypothetical protein